MFNIHIKHKMNITTAIIFVDFIISPSMTIRDVTVSTVGCIAHNSRCVLVFLCDLQVLVPWFENLYFHSPNNSTFSFRLLKTLILMCRVLEQQAFVCAWNVIWTETTTRQRMWFHSAISTNMYSSIWVLFCQSYVSHGRFKI